MAMLPDTVPPALPDARVLMVVAVIALGIAASGRQRAHAIAARRRAASCTSVALLA